ncbi:FixH family protein [Sorangium sp. So ce590]|uniref:FixH family protein n=1 Tax=unclassified Sorangium TaxID=2621164 RepID=UPI003F5EB502
MIEPRDRLLTRSSRERRGARARRAALAALAVLLLQGCGSSDREPDPGDRQDVGVNGRIEFAVQSTEPIKRGPNTFNVRLTWTDSGNPVKRIKLRVYARMLSMGHGSGHDGVEIEPGLYQVANVPLSMQGAWDVECRALAASLIDEAGFTFEVQ